MIVKTLYYMTQQQLEGEKTKGKTNESRKKIEKNGDREGKKEKTREKTSESRLVIFVEEKREGG